MHEPRFKVGDEVRVTPMTLTDAEGNESKMWAVAPVCEVQ